VAEGVHNALPDVSGLPVCCSSKKNLVTTKEHGALLQKKMVTTEERSTSSKKNPFWIVHTNLPMDDLETNGADRDRGCWRGAAQDNSKGNEWQGQVMDRGHL